MDDLLFTMRLLINLFNVLAFAYLAVKSRKVQYVILEIYFFFALVARATIIIEGADPVIYNILLTLTVLISWMLAAYCLYEDYTTNKKFKEIRNDLYNNKKAQ